LLGSQLNQEPVLREVSQELEVIAEYLCQGKLRINIFSQLPALAAGLHQFLSTRQDLQQFYQFQISNFTAKSYPTPASLPPYSTLILKPNISVGQQQICYQLSSKQNILIGRESQSLQDDCRSNNALLIPLPMYRTVSGVHAQIRPEVNSSSSSSAWLICDLNSRNGTYINGQKLCGCKKLQSGDRITLAYPFPSEKSPEFVFEVDTNTTANQTESTLLFDSNIIFLIIEPKCPLTDDEKQLIEDISKNKSKLIIIGDISETDPHIAQNLRENLNGIESWIKIQFTNLDFELKILPLYPFYQGNLHIHIEPSIQPEFDEFCDFMIRDIKNQSETIFLNMLTSKISFQIHRIEQVITNNEEILKRHIQQTKDKLEGREIKEWKKHIYNTLRKVRNDKENFFRQIREELSYEKDNYLTSEFSQNCLPYKVKQFINNLQPVISKNGEQVYIQLQPEGNRSLHQAIIEFCQSELTEWSNEQWKQICNIYSDGGLNGFISRSNETINCIPSFISNNSFPQPSPLINVHKTLQDGFVEIQPNTSYDEVHVINAVVGDVAKIVIQVGVAAGLSAFEGPVAFIQPLPGIFASIANLIGSTLSRTEVQKLKLEEVTQRLKQKCCDHYQSLAKNLVERLVININLALEKEELQFHKNLEKINQEFEAYLHELKTCIDNYRIQEKELSQQRVDLKQIKRMLAQI